MIKFYELTKIHIFTIMDISIIVDYIEIMRSWTASSSLNAKISFIVAKFY
jgi:hypothetical protein